MSICVDYYFNSDKKINVLTEEINGWLGCNLAPYEGNKEDLFCRLLDMELSFGMHTLENDLDIIFQDYKYEIGIRIPMGNSHLRDLQIPIMTFIAIVFYWQMKITGMLVYDSQILLAKYEEKFNLEMNKNDLFDAISNKFVKIPQHLNDLNSLL